MKAKRTTVEDTNHVMYEKILKGVIRIRKSEKDRQHNGLDKKDKGQTTIYKTLHRTVKIEQHVLH